MDEKCGWMYFASADIGMNPLGAAVPAMLFARRTKRLGRFANPVHRSVDCLQLRLHRIIRSSFVRGLHMCCRCCSLALISDGVFLRAVESLVALETAANGNGC